MRKNLKRNPIQGYKIQKSPHDFSFQHSICNIVRLLNFLALERVPPQRLSNIEKKNDKKVCWANMMFSNQAKKNGVETWRVPGA